MEKSPHFNGCNFELWEWISYIIPKCIMGEIIHDRIKVMLVKL